MDTKSTRVTPTGDCWCGCGEPAARGSFFYPGHDAIAKTGVIAAVYGGDEHVPMTVRLMIAHGFGPGGKNAHEAYEAYKARKGR
jgi:hypothetical protein